MTALGITPPSLRRRLIDMETHRTVFDWVLKVSADEGLLKNNRMSMDARTLEANAPIAHREIGEPYNEFLKKLAAESGIETLTREQLATQDRKHPRTSANEESESPEDPDSRIVTMKGGGMQRAHKAEHAVDLETGAVVTVALHPAPASRGETQTVPLTRFVSPLLGWGLDCWHGATPKKRRREDRPRSRAFTVSVTATPSMKGINKLLKW